MTEIPALLYSLFLSYTMERIAAGGLCMKKWLLGIIAAGIVILAGVFMRAVLFDREEVKMTVVRSLFEAPKVALTFDDGPNAKYTPQLLEGLKERGIHVTFFLMGKNIGGNEELVRQMQEEGHLIGNHTYNHVELGKASASTAREEIEKTSNEIYEVTGVYPSYIRPPFGSWRKNLELSVTMLPVFWDVDTLDWKSKNVDSVLNIVQSEVEDGSIILMHDGYQTSVDAALKVVDLLTGEGYEFVTVDQLLVL